MSVRIFIFSVLCIGAFTNPAYSQCRFLLDGCEGAPPPRTSPPPRAAPEASSTPGQAPARTQRQPSGGGLLQECLASYVKRNGPFRPEGTSDKDYKSRSDMTSMCRFAIANNNYYWRYIKCSDPAMARFCVKDPMMAGR